MNFRIAAYTDVGIRKKTNQDSVLVKMAQTDYGKVCLASVCDGVGGLAQGELASAAAVRYLSEWFENEFPYLLSRGLCKEGLEEQWEDLIRRLNRRIRDYGSRAHIDLGTTMVVLLIVNHSCYFANVGDSRIYMLADELSLLTKDQTFLQRELDEGRITAEKIRGDPRRHVLLQCVGASGEIQPVFGGRSVSSGSSFLLCSDGFYHVVTAEEIYQHLGSHDLSDESSMQKSLMFLTDLAKYRGEPDNISAVLIRCD